MSGAGICGICQMQLSLDYWAIYKSYDGTSGQHHTSATQSGILILPLHGITYPAPTSESSGKLSKTKMVQPAFQLPTIFWVHHVSAIGHTKPNQLGTKERVKNYRSNWKSRIANQNWRSPAWFWNVIWLGIFTTQPNFSSILVIIRDSFKS